MIPKIIHYCWFGKQPFGELEQRCYSSWRKHLPEYEFILWNEKSFDVNQFNFSKTAYSQKKYAFVSDVCRLQALYKYGGIYLDTDMIVLKSFDSLLLHDFFLGEEQENQLSAGIIGACPMNKSLKIILDFYSKTSFNPNKPITIPNLLNKYLNRNSITVYSKDFFYPMPYSKRNQDHDLFKSSKTIAVHLWSHSWKSEFGYLSEGKYWKSLKCFMDNLIINPKNYLNKNYIIKYWKFFIVKLLPIKITKDS